MEEQRHWHRLFGMSWTDTFAGLPVLVEMEKDLSQKQQLLDVAIKIGRASCRERV